MQLPARVITHLDTPLFKPVLCHVYKNYNFHCFDISLTFQSYATVFGNEDGAVSDVHDFSSRAQLLGQEELDDVQKALRKEITIFERREALLGSFKVQLVLFIVVCGHLKKKS